MGSRTFDVQQGGFGALIVPQGFGLLKEMFNDDELVRATRLFGPSTGLAIDASLWHIGWRLVFLINVPIGLIALPWPCDRYRAALVTPT